MENKEIQCTTNKKCFLKDLSVFCINSILAGFSISIGAMIFLYVLSFDPSSVWLKALGAVFFNLGLLSVMFFGFKLFTGMNAVLVDMPIKEWYKLPICFIFNSVGIWIGALLIFKVPGGIGDSIVRQAIAITNAKMSANIGYAFVASIMCGVLITLAVLGYKKFIEKSATGAIIAVFFPIFVFVMLGVDHSVANQMYFALSCLGGNGFSPNVILHTFLVMIGNILGGVFIPLLLKLRTKLEK